jgi:RimJ/RimL family protein N-acetyltransferase
VFVRPKLIYRPFELSDLQAVQKAINSDEMPRTNGIFGVPPSLGQLEDLFLAKDNPQTGRIKLGGFSKNGDVCSCLDIFNIDLVNGRAEIGLIVFLHEERRCGYGSEMLELSKHIAFHSLNLRKLHASVFASNLPSLELFQKDGWTKVATLPEWIWHKDSYMDLLVLTYEN